MCACLFALNKLFTSLYFDFKFSHASQRNGSNMLSYPRVLSWLKSIYKFLGDYISSRKNNKLVTLQFCVLQVQHKKQRFCLHSKNKMVIIIGKKPVTF